VRPRHQQYSLAHVRLFLRALVRLPASLRAAAGLFKLLGEEGLAPAELQAGPTPACGRLWLLRVGLYEIQRPKERADDWVWIVDHTIQLGATRVLLIVGVRALAWEAKGRGALEHQDLQIMLLEPVQKSNAQVVLAQFEKAAEIHGPPRAILSDQCRELNLAVAQFQEAHPQTVGLNDIKHRLALLLERRLKPDARWTELLSACQQMRKKSQQTPLAFLAPPSTKEKARFMNLDELIGWATATRKFLDDPHVPLGVALDHERLESVFGELRAYDAPLAEWQALMNLTNTALHQVRADGYHSGCVEAVRGELAPLAKSDVARTFVEDVVAFIAEQARRLKPCEHLPGSSEVIESLIGKGKRLEGQQSKGGFTRMVLGMAAAVAPHDTDYYRRALESVRTKHVNQWAQTHLGPSLQGLRQQTLGRIRQEQIQDKPPTPASPTF
jgi:hypothetical protein